MHLFSLTEAISFTKQSSSVKILENLPKNNIQIVTMGVNGIIYSDQGKYYQIETQVRKERDPTGAGDTYAGSYIYSLLMRSRELSENAVFASAAASQMVEATGPDFSMTLTEVESRVKKIRKKIKKLK